MGKLAPIVLFVYNRMEHTKQTVEALLQNDLAIESDLYVYSDGSKDGEEGKVESVREYIRTIKGFKNVYIIEREKNWGLANSIIAGVTETIETCGKVIVLEDDFVCAKCFLMYMNRALDKYSAEKKVFSITGYSFLQDEEAEDVPDTYFASITSSRTWATWKDRWQYFDEGAKGYRRLTWDYKLRRKFNYDNTYAYYSMLKQQMKQNTFIKRVLGTFPHKKIDSWAIRWYWSVFKQGGLTLYPRQSLTVHIGYDGSGTHCGDLEDKFHTKEKLNIIKNINISNIRYEDNISEQEWIRGRIKQGIQREIGVSNSTS